MNRLPMAHRAEDLAALPRVTRDDVRNLLYLIAFALTLVAITAVPPEWLVR